MPHRALTGHCASYDQTLERTAHGNLDQHLLAEGLPIKLGVIRIAVPLFLCAFGIDLGIIELTPQGPVVYEFITGSHAEQIGHPSVRLAPTNLIPQEVMIDILGSRVRGPAQVNMTRQPPMGERAASSR